LQSIKGAVAVPTREYTHEEVVGPIDERNDIFIDRPTGEQQGSSIEESTLFGIGISYPGRRSIIVQVNESFTVFVTEDANGMINSQTDMLWQV
jgi:hypothetical protein